MSMPGIPSPLGFLKVPPHPLSLPLHINLCPLQAFIHGFLGVEDAVTELEDVATPRPVVGRLQPSQMPISSPSRPLLPSSPLPSIPSLPTPPSFPHSLPSLSPWSYLASPDQLRSLLLATPTTTPTSPLMVFIASLAQLCQFWQQAAMDRAQPPPTTGQVDLQSAVVPLPLRYVCLLLSTVAVCVHRQEGLSLPHRDTQSVSVYRQSSAAHTSAPPQTSQRYCTYMYMSPLSVCDVFPAPSARELLVPAGTADAHGLLEEGGCLSSICSACSNLICQAATAPSNDTEELCSAASIPLGLFLCVAVSLSGSILPPPPPPVSPIWSGLVCVSLHGDPPGAG